MQLPIILQDKIIKFLTSLPNIDDVSKRQAFIYSVGLDEKLQAQLSFNEPPAQFVPLLVKLLIQYGKIHDGRHALEAVLEAAKNYVGQEGKASCDALIHEVKTTLLNKSTDGSEPIKIKKNVHARVIILLFIVLLGSVGAYLLFPSSSPSLPTGVCSQQSKRPLTYNPVNAQNDLRVYVWDFVTRDGVKNELTTYLTQEFEKALFHSGCCFVLVRSQFDRLIFQKDAEKAIISIEGFSQESLEQLKCFPTEVVIFGEVYENPTSDEITITAIAQGLDRINIGHKVNIDFPREKVSDMATRKQSMQILEEKLCPFLSPVSGVAHPEVVLVLGDIAGEDQVPPETTQTLANNLKAIAETYNDVQAKKYRGRIAELDNYRDSGDSIIIAIGGEYESTGQGVIFHVHLQIRNLPGFMPSFIQDYHVSIDLDQPSELIYFRHFIEGISRLVVKDWEHSIIQLSESLEQLSNSIDANIKSTIYALRGRAYMWQGEIQRGYDDFVRAKAYNSRINSTVRNIKFRFTQMMRGVRRLIEQIFKVIIIILRVIFIIFICVVIIGLIGILIMKRIKKRLKEKSRDHSKPSQIALPYREKPDGEKVLLLALGIETFGGDFTKILEEGSKIPHRHTGIFTTVQDYQTAVKISILEGLRRSAKDNLLIGELTLVGIPPAYRGVPQIEVVFNINSNGVLQVQATDLGTMRKQKVKVLPLTKIDNATVKRLQREAEKAFRAGEERPTAV